MKLSPGDTAPAFELRGSDDTVYRLSDFEGRRAVVLAWFPKAFTGGWTRECKSFRESGERIRAFDVGYFAASTDKPETNRKFAASLELDYPILSDPTRETARAYGVLKVGLFAARHTFYIGIDGKILYVDTRVKASTAGDDVAARLEQLGIRRSD